MSILCRLGFHRWERWRILGGRYPYAKRRECSRCYICDVRRLELDL